MSKLDFEKILGKLAEDLQNHLQARQINDPLFIGIRTGGVWVAENLQSILEDHSELGILDITFYRDDFSRVGLQPNVKPSKLPLDLNSRHIILVDDVLHTGRTVRAALNEIFDYGRPASVSFAVLVVRNGRELPIQADVAGYQIELKPEQHIKLNGPEPLALEIVS